MEKEKSPRRRSWSWGKAGATKKPSTAEGMEVHEDIFHLQAEINNILEEEDLKWKQLAKEHWLKLGDKNSKFYHACVSQKRRANTIDQIIDVNRRQCSTEYEIKEAFVDYFEKKISTSSPSCIDLSLEGLSLKVTSDMNCRLLQPCAFEEVSVVVGQMVALKALGCDSLPAEFFHDNWSSIRQKVFSVVSNFFCTSRFDDEINRTIISLITLFWTPKIY